MADPVHTLAGLQAELTAFSNAIEAQSWETARKSAARYETVRLGIAAQASADGGSASLPPPPKPPLLEQIKLHKEVAASIGDAGMRRVHGRMSYFA